MAVMNIQWNNCGSVLAVAGVQRAAGQVFKLSLMDKNSVNSHVNDYGLLTYQD